MNQLITKVCFFSPDSYPYFNSKSASKLGGAEYQIYLFATELARDPDFEVHVIVDQNIQNRKEVIENVNIHGFPVGFSRFKYIKTALRLIPLFFLFRSIDADVYIQRGASHWTGIIRILTSILGKRFVYMAAHDGDADRSLHPRRKGLIRRVMWWTYEYGVRRADLVISQNEFQQQQFKKNYGRDSVLRLSAHRIPDERSTTDKSTVLWVGRAKEWKRPDLFVELAREFPNKVFEMVMPSFGEKNEKIKQVKEKIIETKNITFHEYVPPNKIDELFRRAKVYVLTSTDEGFPNTFIQAAKAGAPILSYCVDPNGILEKYEIGVNAGRDKDVLKNELSNILDKVDYQEHLSKNAWEYARKHHNIKIIVEKDKQWLRSLL